MSDGTLQVDSDGFELIDEDGFALESNPDGSCCCGGSPCLVLDSDGHFVTCPDVTSIAVTFAGIEVWSDPDDIFDSSADMTKAVLSGVNPNSTFTLMQDTSCALVYHAFVGTGTAYDYVNGPFDGGGDPIPYDIDFYASLDFHPDGGPGIGSIGVSITAAADPAWDQVVLFQGQISADYTCERTGFDSIDNAITDWASIVGSELDAGKNGTASL